MILIKDLRRIVKARLSDSEVLLKNHRYEGAIYLCGYAVEIGLKIKICKRLNWTGFPEIRSEFTNYQSFKTHDLDVLLHLSGVESKIKTKFFADWSIIALWDPESRYKTIGTAKMVDAKNMITASKNILEAIK